MEERSTHAVQASRIRIGELPDLRIVAMDTVLPHEEPDDRRRSALEERLLSERVLKNPPIVADPGSGRLIVLDGANRVTAMRNLGIEHLPVQVVRLDDPNLEIRSWHHAVERLDREYFLRKLSGEGGVSLRDAHRSSAGGAAPDPGAAFTRDDAAASPRDDAAASAGDDTAASPRDAAAAKLNGHLCAFTFPTGEEIAVEGRARLFERVESLGRITGLYRDGAFFDRVSYTGLEDLRLHYPGFTALVSFRPFRKDEILEIVRAGRTLPSGITRVLLPKRALGINMPLDVLERRVDLERKNHDLRELIRRKVADKSIRFYEEPTFRFDE